MGQNIFNLGLRFVLEIAALVAVGYWGWQQHNGVLRYVLAIGLPLGTAVLWATFRVVGEAGGGQPIVAVAGWVRLLLELALFSFAVWGLHNAGAKQFACGLGIILIIHYLLAYDRLWWLLQH